VFVPFDGSIELFPKCGAVELVEDCLVERLAMPFVCGLFDSPGLMNWGVSAPFVLHNLRRSVVTGLARIGVDLPIIERIVNHASGSFRGIISTYQKYSFEPEMRKALDRWGVYVENLPRTIIARPVVEAAIMEAAE
jgi:hypothetical protein